MRGPAQRLRVSADTKSQEPINRATHEFEKSPTATDEEKRWIKRPIKRHMQRSVVVFPGILAIVRTLTAALDSRSQHLDLVGH